MTSPHPHGHHNRLPAWQKRLLDLTLLTLALSGAAWLLIHYRWGAGSADMLPHPAELWLIRAHGLAGFLALFVLGSLSALHIPRGWRHGQRLPSAISVLLAWSITLLTAYLLYYFSSESSRASIGWVHVGVAGLLWLTIFLHRRQPSHDTAGKNRENPRP